VNENNPVPVGAVTTFGPLLDVGPFTAPKLNREAGLDWSVDVAPVNENGAGLLWFDETVVLADGRDPEKLNGTIEFALGRTGSVVVALGKVVGVFDGVNEKGVFFPLPDGSWVLTEGTVGFVPPVNENKDLAVDEVTAETAVGWAPKVNRPPENTK
jgi:hypothetical protein